MNRDDALKKIKKCLALGRSGEAHEAAAAMRQAQKLMEQFELHDQDVALSDIAEVAIKACSTGVNAWEVALVAMVAEAFGCEHYTSRRSRWNSAGNYVADRLYIFVGLQASAQVASYAFEVLGRQCAKARLVHIGKQPKSCKPITKTARGDAFAKGWVASVRDLVERFAQPAGDKQLLLTYMEAKHPDMAACAVSDKSQARKTDWGHLAAGHKAGQSASLNRGVGGMDERRLLA